jgi:hypothetical protein
MRELAYLSPTSISKWEEDPEAFYLYYLSENRPPREPQTQPMSIGSAFDARAKSYLYEMLFGPQHDPKFSFDAIFEAQVEPHNRDWALQHSEYVMEQYRQSGALLDLMLELKHSQGTPRFEFEVRGAVHGYREGVQIEFSQGTLTSCILLGKPDVHFVNKDGASVVLDFKVNGYCSRTPPSPMRGYLRLRSAGKTDLGMHKSCMPMVEKGMRINVAEYMENLNKDWARQLAIYAWLLGESIGSRFILAIDQICCDATRAGLPGIRVAEHRCVVGPKFQHATFLRACEIWEIIKSGHIFRGTPDEPISREDSEARCRALDGIKDALAGDGTTDDEWFSNVTYGSGRYG